MPVPVILYDITVGVISNMCYDLIKKGLSSKKGRTSETIGEVYGKRFENPIASLSNVAGTDRLFCSKGLLFYARNDMILHAILLNVVSEEEQISLKKDICSHLLYLSGIREQTKISSSIIRQTNSLIVEYQTIAKELLLDIDPDGMIRSNLLNSTLNVRNMVSLSFEQARRNEGKLEQILNELIPDQEDLSRSLYIKLESDRRNHPSFHFMYEYKDEFSPTTNELYLHHNPFGLTHSSNETKPVWELIQESWKKTSRTNIVLEGEGGIGKTVTLLNAVNISKIRGRIATLYIQAKDFDDGNGQPLTFEQCIKNLSFPKCDEIIKLSDMASWVDDFGTTIGPSVLLLLDGINEISPTLQGEVLEKLADWSGPRSGVQIIAATRPQDGARVGYQLPGDTLAITLLPIPELIAKEYVTRDCTKNKCPEKIPSDDSPLWEFLVYPLFLTIFLSTAKLKALPYKSYTLALRENISGPNTLLLNFMQRELCRKRSSKWVFRAAMVFEYIYPRIAYEMVMRQTMSLTKSDIRSLVKEMVSTSFEEEYTKLPFHIQTLYTEYEIKESILPTIPNPETWYNLVFNECGLLSTPKNEQKKQTGELQSKSYVAPPKSTFVHQTFRDCLAAVYLLNHVDCMTDSIPSCWKESFPSVVMSSVSEIVTKEQIEALWNQNRKDQQYTNSDYHKSHHTTSILLELWKERGVPKELDFSGMDLCNYSIAKYCRTLPNHEPLFSCSRLSKETKINKNTFTRIGHKRSVSCVVSMSDGCIVSGSGDGKIIVWDSNTGEALSILSGLKGRVDCITVLPEGQIASSAKDCAVHIWKLACPEHPTVLRGHKSRITCISYLQDGRIASGSKDGTIRIWDMANPIQPDEVLEHKGGVTCMAVFPNGDIVSGSADSNVRIWSLTDIERPTVLLGHKRTVTCISSLPDGRIASGSDDGTICIWDKANPKQPDAVLEHKGGVTCIAVLPDGRIVSGSDDGVIHIWDLVDLTQKPIILENHKRQITCIAVLPNGDIASGSRDRTISVRNLSELLHPKILQHKGGVNCITSLPDGRIVSGSSGSDVYIWNYVESKQPTVFLGPRDGLVCISVLPDGRIASGFDDGTIRVWDLENPVLSTVSFRFIRMLKCVAYLPDGRIATGASDHSVCVWEGTAHEPSMVLRKHRHGVTCIAVLPDGRIASGSDDGTIRIWDLLDPKKSFFFPDRKHLGRKHPITCICIYRDGRIISGSSDDDNVRIWDLTDLKHPIVLSGHKRPVTCITFLPNGNVVSGSKDGTIRLWDIEDPDNPTILSSCQGPVTSVTVLQNEKVASGHRNGVICIWDLKSQKHVAIPSRNQSLVRGLAVLPNGCLVSAFSDGEICVWNLDKKLVYTKHFTDVDVSQFDFSEIFNKTDIGLFKLLWENGAIISDKERELFYNDLWKSFDFRNQ